MSEKQFRVRFEQENGRGEIINEKGVELTAREVVNLLDNQQVIIDELLKENKKLRKELNNCENFRYQVFKRIREINT